jgi:hypothetical protein
VSKVDDVIKAAVGEIGEPYQWGAEGPDAFDCSGLMQFIFAKVGIPLPRTARAQQAALPAVTGQLQPGDLVFYDRPASHVGVYIGQGRMIDAPHSGATVRIRQVGDYTSAARPQGLGAGGIVESAGDAFAKATGLDAVGGAITSGVRNVVTGARNVALEGAFLALGLGLVAVGLWKATAGARQRVTERSSELGDAALKGAA